MAYGRDVMFDGDLLYRQPGITPPTRSRSPANSRPLSVPITPEDAWRNALPQAGPGPLGALRPSAPPPQSYVQQFNAGERARLGYDPMEYAAAVRDHPTTAALAGGQLPTDSQAYQANRDIYRQTGNPNYMPRTTLGGNWNRSSPWNRGQSGSGQVQGDTVIAYPQPQPPAMVSGIRVRPSIQSADGTPAVTMYTRQTQFPGDVSMAGYQDQSNQIVGIPRGDGTMRPGLRSELPPDQQGNAPAMVARSGKYMDTSRMLSVNNRIPGAPRLQLDPAGNVIDENGVNLGNQKDVSTQKKVYDQVQSSIYRRDMDSKNAAWGNIRANRQAQNAGFANAQQMQMFRDIMMARAAGRDAPFINIGNNQGDPRGQGMGGMPTPLFPGQLNNAQWNEIQQMRDNNVAPVKIAEHLRQRYGVDRGNQVWRSLYPEGNSSIEYPSGFPVGVTQDPQTGRPTMGSLWNPGTWWRIGADALNGTTGQPYQQPPTPVPQIPVAPETLSPGGAYVHPSRRIPGFPGGR